MATLQEISERFRDLNFHDATFVSMRVFPAQSQSEANDSLVQIQLLAGRTNRVLQFTGCTNLRTALDFDVLAHNSPSNTSSVDAHTDAERMRKLMRSQEQEWDVGYGKMRSPLDDKLEVIDELICFRVQFFGGVVEVIARGFSVQNGKA